MSVLDVYLNGVKVGCLADATDGLVFTYDAQYVATEQIDTYHQARYSQLSRRQQPFIQKSASAWL